MTPDDLAALEARVQHALRSGDASGLEILGYGEISSVIACGSGDRRWACKRLPPFADRGRFDAYRACLEEYLERLAAAGVTPVETRALATAGPDGTLAAYCVQPILDPAGLGPRHLAGCERDEGLAFVEGLFERVLGGVRPTLGLDAQLSNWAVTPEGLRYLDVTTPMLRTGDGRERLDVDLFMASLPWALRPPVKRFVIQGLLDTYFRPRAVILDTLANLHKEELAAWIPPLVERANAMLTPRGERPLGEDEIWRYYASDARTYALLQRLRRLDRSWQRGVRRRPYPFLLPGAIERRLRRP